MWQLTNTSLSLQSLSKTEVLGFEFSKHVNAHGSVAQGGAHEGDDCIQLRRTTKCDCAQLKFGYRIFGDVVD